MNSYWAKILKHFEKNHYFNNGLTIPFLIGSRTIIEPQEKLLNVGDLIKQMNSYLRPVTVLYCGQIDEFVFSLIDIETNNMRKQYQNLYKEIDNIICTDQSLNEITNINDLIEKWDKLYTGKIIDKTYSKNNGLWIPYTTLDKDRLGEI
jgi:hypothetical protein